MAYLPGGAYSSCERCGEQKRRWEVRKEWTGLVVCIEGCLDPRPVHLDPPNVYPEGLPLPDLRPEPEPVFVETNEVQPEDI